MGSKKLKSRIIGLSVAGILVILIASVLLPPATAVLVLPGNPNRTTVTSGLDITFEDVELTIRGNEHIPVNNLTFTIYNNNNNNEVAHVIFYIGGTKISDDPSGRFTVSRTYPTEIPDDWYRHHGYGYGYDEPSGPGIDFGPGYGYGYGDNSHNITFRYDITYTTHTTGTFYAKLKVNCSTYDFESDKSTTFSVTSPATPPSGSPGIPTPTPKPVADAGGPYTAYLNERVTFNGQNSYHEDGTLVNWTWTIGNDITLYGVTPSYTFTSEDDIGFYTVTLTVKDEGGATDSDSTTLEVIAIPIEQRLPVPITDGPYLAIVDQDITLDASLSYDPDGTIVNYTWTLGDGSTAYGEIITHSYSSTGTYSISLTVTDNDSLVNTTTTTATIYAGEHNEELDGNFIDSDGDGVFDSYQDKATGVITSMKLRDDGTYLVDVDGDGVWDYIFNPASGELTPFAPLEEETVGFPVWLAILVIIAAILIILVALFKMGYIYLE